MGFISALSYKPKRSWPNIYFISPQHFIFLEVLCKYYLSWRITLVAMTPIPRAVEQQD